MNEQAKVQGVAKIIGQAHPAESLGNVAREIIRFLESGETSPPTGSRLTEEILREKIKVAIGYAPVKLSIRNHPEIKYEYRTTDDRDGLIDRISAALLPSLRTTWIPIDLMFRDRYNGSVRHAPGHLIEVVAYGNEVLFQDAENGTHRLVATQHIENTRTAIAAEREERERTE